MILKAVFVQSGDCGTWPDSFAACVCRVLRRIDAINRTFIRPENVRIFIRERAIVDIRQSQATMNKPTAIGTTTSAARSFTEITRLLVNPRKGS